ncbi:hypothetical protein P7C71_g691, partial [Lecanoromycetidae sp. Uapishka_2]
MVLITYFLMNDNHAADAFAFAGILTRRKLWQAIYFQDTFFTVLLALPPTATHTDVRIEDLHPENDNLLEQANPTDVSYIASMWHLAKIVQTKICTPRSLSLPISQSPAERTLLINEFRRIYMSFPAPLRTISEVYISDLARRNKRLARQTLFLTSNYFHCLMLVYADQHANFERDDHGILNAAHDAISSFFLLHAYFSEEAKVWYHFAHRAFLEAQMIAETVQTSVDISVTESVRERGRQDVSRMIGILELSSGSDFQASTRVAVLNQYS